MPVSLSRKFSATDPVIDVNVGEPPTVFHVHKGVLVSSSAFIKTKFKPVWSESDTAPVTLADIASDDFGTYVHWLYTHEFPLQLASVGDPDLHSEDWINLANAFVLGERLMDTRYQDSVIASMCDKQRLSASHPIWPSISKMAHIIFDGTLPNSPVRKFLLDALYYCASSDDFAQVDDLPNPLLFELVRLQKAGVQKQADKERAKELEGRVMLHIQPSVEYRFCEDLDDLVLVYPQDMCKYHSHGEGEKCALEPQWEQDYA